MRTLTTAGLALTVALAVALPAKAQRTDEFEGNYDPTRTYEPNAPVGPTTWFGGGLMAGRGTPFAAAIRADQVFVDGMRQHHQGAVMMSQEYLADPAASSPALQRLARAIIANQRYEILLMDDVARRIAEPVRVLDLGLFRIGLRAMATENIGQDRRVLPVPIPGPFVAVGPVNQRDVQFAKGMSMHHAAALDMARQYNADPAATNGYLGILNVNIITEQTQEIAFMQGAMQAYPGDLAAVQVPDGMMHGMRGMAGGQAMAEGAGHAGH